MSVLTFACSGTPIGMNLPNYEDVRSECGSKNFNFPNVLAPIEEKTLYFLRKED